ncbi:hypothetical protein P875_00065061 [Aspergillus parasiticus SU-1]|uniref:Uncharacterized protein n=1 Tax=Aspergillus parasiticus (strain ATCC 56775 / NRRL 5862 / SRRC 143 / SU-1) TaxID=1403190 RepID=A0A0F0IC75_ASPPU|nr:hypothetical protein P875_00065061 [Aspergillus parasiticus SU-1]
MNRQNIHNLEQSSNNRSPNNESSNNESSNNESSNNLSSNDLSSNNQSSNNQSSNNHSSNNQSSDSTQGSSYETPNTDPLLLTRYAEDSDYYRSFLEQLLDLVCNEDQETVSRLVSIIRSGASQREILAVISEMQNGNNRFGENGVTGS